MTIDEPAYIRAFVNMHNACDFLYNVESGLCKNIYQYRATQMILGRLFNFLRGLGVHVHLVTSYHMYLMYKTTHWVVCILLLTALIWVIWKYYIPEKFKQGVKGLLTLIVLSSVAYALPVNILMCKVCNYDGMSTYMSLLGIFLAGAFILKNNWKIAFFAILTATLGAMAISLSGLL